MCFGNSITGARHQNNHWQLFTRTCSPIVLWGEKTFYIFYFIFFTERVFCQYSNLLRLLNNASTCLLVLLFLKAWKLGMHGGDYVWILPGETIDLSGTSGDWWHSGPEDCSPSQLSQTLDGLIIVKSYGTGLTEEASFSGLVSIWV